MLALHFNHYFCELKQSSCIELRKYLLLCRKHLIYTFCTYISLKCLPYSIYLHCWDLLYASLFQVLIKRVGWKKEIFHDYNGWRLAYKRTKWDQLNLFVKDNMGINALIVKEKRIHSLQDHTQSLWLLCILFNLSPNDYLNHLSKLINWKLAE